ncbi:MAG: type II CAAX endopeptidase family protein [Lachnospiraceae bacterium]|nr:CPBP family intramembrane metalloprotease [Robinsoniella sp.]MDY3767160.1 type II CAAX endopeptidase family protein [Lachnospiraceae bacterium]
MIVEKQSAHRRIRNTNRLFLGSLCFVTAVSLSLGFGGVSMSMEMNLILTQLLFWIPIILYLLLTRTNPFRLIPFHRISLSTVCMIILFTLLLIPVVTWVNMISMLFVDNTVVEIDQQLQPNSLLVNVLLMALMPAVSEELMVRGIYFQQYKVSGIFKGAVLSGIAFGMMHMNFNQFSYALVIGVIFALLVEATGSIFASMTAHFVFNGYNVVLTYILQDEVLEMTQETAVQEVMQTDLIQMLFGYTTVAFITGILAFSVYLWIVQHCGRGEHMKQIFCTNRSYEGEKIKVITPTLVLGIIVGVGIMIFMEWIA